MFQNNLLDPHELTFLLLPDRNLQVLALLRVLEISHQYTPFFEFLFLVDLKFPFHDEVDGEGAVSFVVENLPKGILGFCNEGKNTEEKVFSP